MFGWHKHNALAIIEPGDAEFAGSRQLSALVSPDPPASDLVWQRVPDRLALREEVEKLNVASLVHRVAEIAGIGMGYALHKSVRALQSFNLTSPEINRAMTEEREQRVVLGQRVGKLDNRPEKERPW